MTAEIVQMQQVKKQYESRYMCSACGADRDCNCNAAAVEKLAKKVEQERQARRAYRERQKDEQNQTSRDIPSQNQEERPAERKSRFEGKSEDESAGALASFRMACNQWLPKMNKDDLLEAANYFAQKSGVF